MKTETARLFDFRKHKHGGERTGAASELLPASARKLATESERAVVAEMMAEGMKDSLQHQRGVSHARAGKHSAEASQVCKTITRQERRHRRRVKISAPVRVRQVSCATATEFDLTMTEDVSREGILFETSHPSYQRGQEVAVVFPYRSMPGEQVKEQRGQVVRVVRASESRYGVAVAFVAGPPTYELIDSAGNPLGERRAATPRTKSGAKSLIIVVDADAGERAMLRTELEMQGYMVEAVPDPSVAVTLLRHRTPVALICEAEPFPGVMPGGGEISGYDLCVMTRRNPKLGRLPIILTTRTGLPTDFATAHALGATVCVAKPYDLARVANLLRMLVPAE